MYKAGIIGCGRVANVHAGGYKKASETKLFAACEKDLPKLQAFSEKWEVSRQYTDYEEMLEKEELDIVSICTKDNQHPEPTIKAAESSVKGIFCEKPMAYTLEEADKMIEACDKANVKLSLDHSMRFEANYRNLFKIAQSGELGELRCVRFNNLGGSTSINSLLHDTHSFDALLFYAGADVSWLSARVQKEDSWETITGYVSFKNGIYATFEYGGRRNYGTYELILEGSDGTLSAVHGKRNSLDLNGAYSWEPFVRIWKKSDDYEAELSKVKKFWEGRISTGTQITTPNETLNNFYRAHLTHMLITDDREVGSDRYASRVGTFPYGVFPDESCMCISDFDRRGYKKEAEERLQMLIHYQGTVGVPGTYSTIEGQYYGAGGYECGGYNKNHGWVLWGLGEHYWYHRDREWLNCVAPSIVKACDWIISERQSTRKFDSEGKKVIEYGFLPAGSLEDVKDFGFWLATNAPTYWGFKNAARALLDIGHPEGERLLKEAEAYGKDVMAGFREAMAISPVVKLRDGTYVPHFPPRLYRRGRGFGWLRETLEGAIHLIRSEMLEPFATLEGRPWSEESTWILKDYEDNLYISDRYGYSVDDFERDWFSLGGFSMQSNLLCHPIPYLWRDEPKHFLRGYFNAFASAFYPDICALVEHALPTLADHNGVWFKPSDESQSTFWLRLMLIYESGNELNLAMATPREWLGDGKSIKIERAATYLGW